MALPRVVVDTNIVVSGALKRLGAESKVLDLIAERALLCFVSAAILAEYDTVLRRARLKLERSRRDGVLEMIFAESTLIEPASHVNASPDESDNRFLECAEAADADFLVTGNKRHFPKQWKSTEIVNARELLARLNQ